MFALIRAADKGFRAAAIVVLAGILIGIAGLACAPHTEHLFIGAQRAHGGPIHGDMPGFGAFMLGMFGVFYFGCISLGIAIIAVARKPR